MTIPITLEDRLIAFFDILGFSKRLEHRSIDETHILLSQFLETANARIFNRPDPIVDNTKEKVRNFSVTQFAFDTLILISEDPRQSHSDANFIFACIEIIQQAAAIGLPMRGAIGVGSVLTDQKKGILLSQEFAKLAKLEKDQEWMGCILTTEAAARISEPLFGPGGPQLIAKSPVVPYQAPRKWGYEDEPKAKFVLNWVSTSIEEQRNLASTLPEPKGKNTEDFINTIKALEGFQKRVAGSPPVQYFQYISCRLAVTHIFLNEIGRPVDPISPLEIMISDGNFSSTVRYESKDPVLVPAIHAGRKFVALKNNREEIGLVAHEINRYGSFRFWLATAQTYLNQYHILIEKAKETPSLLLDRVFVGQLYDNLRTAIGGYSNCFFAGLVFNGPPELLKSHEQILQVTRTNGLEWPGTEHSVATYLSIDNAQVETLGRDLHINFYPRMKDHPITRDFSILLESALEGIERK